MMFLRFPDEKAFINTAPRDEDGNIAVPNLDVIGLIYQGGEYDEEGNIITSPTPLEGYHVNMIGNAPDAWVQYVINRPSNPHRVFAGS